ncbi:MAG: hypothetical protein ACKPJD_04605, partial [Planctomycetaceae bacterium]
MPAVADGDVAIAGAAESLRSCVSAEVVTSSGVVLRKVRWLGSWLRLKTRRYADFDVAETAGGQTFPSMIAGFLLSWEYRVVAF